jgi:hypothetical protein
MRTRFTSASVFASLSLALLMSACGSNNSSTGSSTGNAGTNGSGTSGTNGQGTSGTNGQGTSGTNGQGTAGTNGTGTAGTTGAGGTGTAGTTGAGGTGTAGTNGTGTAGTTGAGGTGTAGTTGTGGGAALPTMSPGCNMAPATADKSTTFTQKTVQVTGVDPNFVSKYAVNNGDQFNWTKRNYYLRLPMNYDPTKSYPVDLAGTGCGGNETSGSSGDYTLPSASGGQPDSIQIGLSYVTSNAANPSCVAFTDGYTNSPEVQYIGAVIADVEAKYCVNENQVFINGYSSGAWEAILGGGTNQDKIRAFGVQIGGGLRMTKPTFSTKPVAAFFVVGLLDQGNPIGPLATPLNDSTGSAAARDELLVRNGCVAAGTQIVDTCADMYMMAATPPETPLPCEAGIMNGDTVTAVPHAQWDATNFPKCYTYTGCPAKYPVVWCPLLVNHGNGPNPMGADAGPTGVENYRRAGMWKFFMSLPAE